MRVVLSWLREFCPTELSADELAERLTRHGLAVESIDHPWDGLAGVIVARVLEVRDHPDSDRLCVTRVDTGTGEMEVVVGVRNMRPGDLVPLAPPGARVPALSQPLARKDIRGVVSNGMLCSPRELAIAPDHTAILVLPTYSAIGADVKEQFGLDDAVLDIEVLANRPDLLSVAGVAREAAAATGEAFRPPDTTVLESDEKAQDAATVEIRDLERCPRYLGRIVREVTVRPSPIDVQARLTASGMRPLSNAVDATNYVMLEMGQPMHPFDLRLLDGAGIVVRRAEEGEALVTLDDVERRLTGEDLVIADLAKGVAIAGVMGSAAAEVSDATEDVLIESAHFERRGVARTSRRLGLETEASSRFSRGVDPEGVSRAADRAVALTAAWSGGSVMAGSVDVGSVPERRRLTIRPARASLVLGSPVSGEDVREAFDRLGIGNSPRDGAVEVEVPGHRADLEREVDLVEEVARVRGYERLGTTLPGVKQAGGLQGSYVHRRRVRTALVRAGLRETTSMSFASGDDLQLMGHAAAVRVKNPLSAGEGYLRTSLIPNLLRTVWRNLARQVRGAAVFEVGRIFLPGDPVEERDAVAFAMAGVPSPGLHRDRSGVDFFDAKGVVEALLASLGIQDWTLRDVEVAPLHPARSAEIDIAGEPAGVMGELDPRVGQRIDLPGRVCVGELDSSVLARRSSTAVAFREVPRFPPVRRDLAFVVDAGVAAGALRGAVVDAAGELAGSVVLFDVFSGGPIPEGKKSLAFSVDFRAVDRTLTDQEVDQVVLGVVERLADDFGAELRAG